MSPESLGTIGIIILVVLILLRVQVGIALLLVGFTGYYFLSGPDVALAQLGTSAFGTASKYTLSVMPMFILMGMFLSYSGLAKDLFRSVDSWVGHIRGGLGMATIGASAIFSSISGSNNATAATLGRVALPEMKEYKYEPGVSASWVAAGGTLGVLIPPSVILILYGVLTMEPVGPLLIGGLIPGILLALLMMLTVYIQVRRKPSLGGNLQEAVPFKDKIKSIQKIWPFILIFMLSIGGIYFGFFTPTEAGGVGALGSLLFAVFTRRLSWKDFLASLDDTIRLTSMIFIILIGATLFGQFLAVSRIPAKLTSLVVGTDLSAYTIMALILLIYLFLGLFLEGIAILVLTLPIVYPLIIELGFDGIWFGVIMVIVFNIGSLTPPLGISIFVVNGVAPEIPIHTIFKGIIPMVITMVIFTIILIIFPEIVMTLPNLME
ncbi:tripartite ATP-independent transporter DctM subunit [Virgibacillus natechei]|uniref:Tripartite ATP-independent transporter DctM subunit n=1 Tax=Virgibacillus natechei TaxID=1216297 RepID=A0ABS4IJU1_9BACI|nr:TRAP transporter large permease [Virgibacillus natechei]MBP1971237.1 tripartite ATP-independent transporter DctM subunit [Virgibacillus natechei]UZD12132.1 TRAP transporter large permease [Virgibacillus natechei]